MKLQVRHDYDCSPQRYWEMYWDDGFDAALQRDSTVDRECIEESEANGLLTRRLRFTARQELPSAVASIIGSKKLVWDQVNVWNEAASSLTWEVLPTFVSPDKFTGKGNFRVTPHGSGCRLEVDGEIIVRVRFIGGRIESQVVSQIEEAYETMHQVSLRWLAEHG